MNRRVDDPEDLFVVIDADDGDENDHGKKGERAGRSWIDVRMARLINFDDVQNSDDEHKARIELKILL